MANALAWGGGGGAGTELYINLVLATTAEGVGWGGGVILIENTNFTGAWLVGVGYKDLIT